jgi:hypothetical protein
MKKLKDIYRILTLPLPPKEAKMFHEGVAKPMFAVAFGIATFAILMDYTMQMVEAIDWLTL